MADEFGNMSNLALADLIGSPMAAIIEGEARAARTTVDFIRDVGFLAPAGDPATDPAFDGELGPMRMVSFEYQKLDENGNPTTIRASVPLLALVPIPGLRVKSAKLSLTARITDVIEDKSAGQGLGLTRPVQLRGGLSPIPSASNRAETQRHTRGAYEVDIDIELETVPITVGVDKLLSTFDQAVSEGVFGREQNG